MKSLVTGAAGFAGSHLVDYLLSQGQEVIALVRGADALSNLEHTRPQIRLERGDLLDFANLRRVLCETRPERIYHLAGLASPSESSDNPRLAYDSNLGGTLNLLLAWRESGSDSRFLYVSSSEVYGAVAEWELPVREESSLRPANPYAGSKAAAELAALQFYYAYGLPIVRVRPFNHTGPRQAACYVCSSIARQVAEIDLSLRPPSVTVGNLKIARDFSDVRDIVRGYYLLLERGQPGEVYQLCSGRATSIQAIAESFVGLALKPVQIVVDETKVRPNETPCIRGDPSKAKQAVGWHPDYDLQATLRDLKLYWQDRMRRDGRG